MFRDGDGPVVACRDLAKRYGDGATAVDALRGVTVEFDPRSFTAIMGPSGTGKSNAHALARGSRPADGRPRVLGLSKLDGLDDGQ